MKRKRDPNSSRHPRTSPVWLQESPLAGEHFSGSGSHRAANAGAGHGRFHLEAAY